MNLNNSSMLVERKARDDAFGLFEGRAKSLLLAAFSAAPVVSANIEAEPDVHSGDVSPDNTDLDTIQDQQPTPIQRDNYVLSTAALSDAAPRSALPTFLLISGATLGVMAIVFGAAAIVERQMMMAAKEGSNNSAANNSSAAANFPENQINPLSRKEPEPTKEQPAPAEATTIRRPSHLKKEAEEPTNQVAPSEAPAENIPVKEVDEPTPPKPEEGVSRPFWMAMGAIGLVTCGLATMIPAQPDQDAALLTTNETTITGGVTANGVTEVYSVVQEVSPEDEGARNIRPVRNPTTAVIVHEFPTTKAPESTLPPRPVNYDGRIFNALTKAQMDHNALLTGSSPREATITTPGGVTANGVTEVSPVVKEVSPEDDNVPFVVNPNSPITTVSAWFNDEDLRNCNVMKETATINDLKAFDCEAYAEKIHSMMDKARQDKSPSAELSPDEVREYFVRIVREKFGKGPG